MYAIRSYYDWIIRFDVMLWLGLEIFYRSFPRDLPLGQRDPVFDHSFGVASSLGLADQLQHVGKTGFIFDDDAIPLHR